MRTTRSNALRLTLVVAALCLLVSVPACGGGGGDGAGVDDAHAGGTGFPTTDASPGFPTTGPSDAVAGRDVSGGLTDAGGVDAGDSDVSGPDVLGDADEGEDAPPPEPDLPPEVDEPGPPECDVDEDCDALGLPPTCQRWACNPGAGECVTVPLQVGTPCDDSVCKSNQVCQGGACVGGSPIPCDDGDVCTDDTCDPVTGCIFTEAPDCCVPDCTGLSCGDDGCGGSCGTCPAEWSCTSEGVCVNCTPSCVGLTCGDDGCGGSCGICPDFWTCEPPGICTACETQCFGKVCGDDGCGGICGSCAPGLSCNELGQCFGCAPDCSGKDCGDDGCGGTCGDCLFAEQCDAAGQCVCAPFCAGKECGDDGCGGSCGGCGAGQVCSPGGACVAQGAGDACTNPFEVDVIPFSATGSTATAADDLGISDWGCGGSGDGPYGQASADHVYRFVPPQADDYDIVLESDFDAVLYLVVDCVDPDGGCLAVTDESAITEQISLFLQGGAEYFLIVDGAGNFADISGQYTLTITGEDFGGCLPQCSGKDCGPNGCGGSCGSCGGNQACSPSGQCVSESTGDTCDSPFIVDTLPYTAQGDTSDATADYGYSSDVCPGEDTAHGDGSKDDAYLFVPPTSGNYLLSLTSDYDSNLYLVADCSDIDGTCLGASESATSLGVEEVVAFLTAGASYYVIVDGFSSLIDFSGPYTLTIEAYDTPGCTPSCAGKVCGPDGCGGQCGACGPGEACLGSSCVDAGAGDTCSDPFVIDGLPFEASASTAGAGADYHYKFGVCPGEVGGWGETGKDHVYAFTPLGTGTYTFILDAEFDGTIYVATNCSDIDGTCVGAVEDTIGVETLTVELQAFTSYLIFVDYYSNSLDDSGDYTLKVSGPG